MAAPFGTEENLLITSGVEGTVTVTGGNTLTVNVTDIYAPTFLSLIGVGDLKVTGDASARLKGAFASMKAATSSGA